MALINGTVEQPGAQANTAPQIVKPLASGAFNAQQASGPGVALQPLVNALMQKKMSNLLANKLPGTTPVAGSPQAQNAAAVTNGNWDGSNNAASKNFSSPIPTYS